MSDPPYMPLYLGDVLKQTLYWTGEERALLILLYAAQWWNGPLPLDLSKLATALQFDDATFRELWHGRVHTLFEETPNGFINEDLEIRRQTVARMSGVRRAAGKASGKARRERTDRNDDGVGDDMFEQNTEHGVRTHHGMNGGSGVRTSIQSNPIHPNPDQPPQIFELASGHQNNQAALSPSEADGSPDEPPPVATATRGKAATRRRRIPADHPTEALREWARSNTPHVNFDAELALIRDHEFRDPHSDWDAVIRNWLRRAEKQKPRSTDEHLTRYERHKRRLYGDA
jgi:uncharacterized protein YdaU (DUF1376 family)